MKRKNATVLLILGIISLIIALCLPRIPQADSYHHFADSRPIFHISNFWNSISNMPFVLIGIWGLFLLKEKKTPSIKFLYIILFSSIILTGIGSTIYHLNPSNRTLIYDRLPLVVLLTSYFLIVTRAIFASTAWKAFCILFIIGGIFSVIWWFYTESLRNGDLRLYAFYQFYPMICLAYLYLAPGQKTNGSFKTILLLYIIAKGFEHWDMEVFNWLPVSGHTLKHFVAALATFYMVKDFQDQEIDCNFEISKLKSLEI